jgi:uncharacterized protein (DUF427 family)
MFAGGLTTTPQRRRFSAGRFGVLSGTKVPRQRAKDPPVGNKNPVPDADCDMTVRATWNNTVVAESDHTILVEGNQYFPKGDVVVESLQPTDTSTHCPWKGDASYYDVVVGGERLNDAAWYYTAPLEAASRIKDYVAFWKGVQVSGENAGTPEIRRPSS